MEERRERRNYRLPSVIRTGAQIAGGIVILGTGGCSLFDGPSQHSKAPTTDKTTATSTQSINATSTLEVQGDEGHSFDPNRISLSEGDANDLLSERVNLSGSAAVDRVLDHAFATSVDDPADEHLDSLETTLKNPFVDSDQTVADHLEEPGLGHTPEDRKIYQSVEYIIANASSLTPANSINLNFDTMQATSGTKAPSHDKDASVPALSLSSSA